MWFLNSSTVRSRDHPLFLNFTLIEDSYCLQGFKDKSLTIWQASCVLRNYELRTGNVVSRDDLDTGVLADQFVEEDYKIDESVCFHSFLPGFSVNTGQLCLFLIYVAIFFRYDAFRR